jgi:hypothetical protein
MRNILCFLLLSLSVLSARSQGFLSGFFDESNQLFGKYVGVGRVDYIAIKNNDKLYNSLISNIGEMDLSGKTPAEQKAFYINAYNILVIKSINDNWPVKSTKDIKGFFNETKHKIAGESLTLDEIEKKIHETFKDPRIHFALVKGNKGLPDAVNFGYFPTDVERKLDEQTKLALNNTRFVQVKDEQKVVFLPPLFKTNEKDFLAGGNKSVLDFVKKYRDAKIPGSYKIDYYPAEWALNDKKR